MPVTILRESPYFIKINRAYMVQKIAGLFILTASIIVFVSFMILEPQRMGKLVTLKIFSMLLILSLMIFLIREFYFLYIDKNNLLTKNGGKFKINNSDFLIEDINSILIIEYNGIGIMSNGFNVFMKLKSGKNIPLSIRISKDDTDKVKDALFEFFNIEKFETKKWWIG